MTRPIPTNRRGFFQACALLIAGLLLPRAGQSVKPKVEFRLAALPDEIERRIKSQAEAAPLYPYPLSPVLDFPRMEIQEIKKRRRYTRTAISGATAFLKIYAA